MRRRRRRRRRFFQGSSSHSQADSVPEQGSGSGDVRTSQVLGGAPQ
jgi:hypothetical protein